MTISNKMMKGLIKQGIPEKYIKAVLKDFSPLSQKKMTQKIFDAMFSIFLIGNLNAVDLDSTFGYMMSPFVGTHYERNGTRSRTKST